uniref:Uncharacterized protein n=1 Tax=Suricata suricatta TaxID=37032 RepID=A0A673TBS9_SURSU
MEPFCPLLLAGVSLPLAKALRGNGTIPADSNLTSTTAGPPDPRAPQPVLAWLLLPVLLLVLLLLLAAYFFRFRKQRKAVVSANDKMPNGILEEQAKSDTSQQVPLRAQEVLSHPRGAPGGGDPRPVGRLQALPGGVQLAAVWTHTRNVRTGQ